MSAPTGAGQPRAIVQVDGSTHLDLIGFETEVNEFTAPDTFSATFPISGLPKDHDAAWWSAAEGVDIEIFAGRPRDGASFAAGDLTSIFVGKVDDVAVDWTERTLTINGRDLTAPLVDTKTSEKFTNKTSSEIVEALAGKYGMTPKVTATTTKVGKFYTIDHVDLKDERTEWDLVTWLAREEGFRVFVKGRELHFEPIPTSAAGEPFVIKRVAADAGQTESGNYVTLRTSRTLTVASDLKVTVKSWNSKKKRSFTATAQRKGKATGVGRGGGQKHKQEYSYTIPGLDLDQAQKRANQILAELSKHAMKLGFDGPAEEGLHVSDTIRLEGTGTAWDQVYFPESIHRTFDAGEDGGYGWSVQAKNQPPENEPTL